MNKIKKWQIVLLIILGGMIFWLFKYPWVIEKKLSPEDYQENIVGIWELTNSSDYTSVNVTEYFIDGTFERRTTDENPRVIVSGTWELENDFLVLTYNDEGWISELINYNTVYKKIVFLTKKHLRFYQEKPTPVGGFKDIETHKKIKQ